MKSILLLVLLILMISFSQHLMCLSNTPSTLIRFSELSIKVNPNYQFKIINKASPVTIIRNDNGTFFSGQFSSILLTRDNQRYEYISTGFSFKYPPQHRITELNNEMIELQITYQLHNTRNLTWKHRSLVLSTIFLLNDYAPYESTTLGKQINHQLVNDSLIDLKALLPLISGLNMVLYKGSHTKNPNDKGVLWMVRKELLLMSEEEFENVKDLIFMHIPKQKVIYSGLYERHSDLHEINESAEIKQKVLLSQPV